MLRFGLESTGLGYKKNDKVLTFSVNTFVKYVCLPPVTQLPGKKDLFIEADLMSPLDRIASLSTLKVKLQQLFFF